MQTKPFLTRLLIQPLAFFKYDLDIDKQTDLEFKVNFFKNVQLFSPIASTLTILYWEQLWWYLKYLLPKLTIEENEDLAQGIIESIHMDSYRPAKTSTENIALKPEPWICYSNSHWCWWW